MKAFYLSLGTLRTTGYGVPDPYFDRCLEGVVLLTAQALVGLFLEAVIIGSFFVRLSNPEKRAKTILFSEEAVIQGRTGVSHFIFQVSWNRSTAMQYHNKECLSKMWMIHRPRFQCAGRFAHANGRADAHSERVGPIFQRGGH